MTAFPPATQTPSVATTVANVNVNVNVNVNADADANEATTATATATVPVPAAVAPPVTLATARRRNPQQAVPSPCVGVCKMDAAKGWCLGCFRTLDELTAWSRATDATKLAVWSLVERRQA